ncbi:hypothetical protein [Actinoplanes sp. NPDC023714]|uniref:hypothetical protein n=1 Tax=Actinoplanes sp. NPDC023714 TaxID=3154322 RepID=UPI00340A83AB
MGYELHITRATVAYESERFPILGAEVEALVREQPDLTIPPDLRYVSWAGGGHHLLFQDGRLSVKDPEPAFRRRMIELAEKLDAWVIGDDAEIYEYDGVKLTERRRTHDVRRHFITRGDDRPIIRADEWATLIGGRSDFITMSTIEAELPSGTRAIPCPPIDCWTGHPSGRPIPFFFNDDDLFFHNQQIEVRDADGHTVHLMRQLAATLDATVTDDR